MPSRLPAQAAGREQAAPSLPRARRHQPVEPAPQLDMRWRSHQWRVALVHVAIEGPWVSGRGVEPDCSSPVNIVLGLEMSLVCLPPSDPLRLPQDRLTGPHSIEVSGIEVSGVDSVVRARFADMLLTSHAAFPRSVPRVSFVCATMQICGWGFHTRDFLFTVRPNRWIFAAFRDARRPQQPQVHAAMSVASPPPPSPPPSSPSVYCLSELACRLLSTGLQIGGAGYACVSTYLKGCYTYVSGHTYSGLAYFGKVALQQACKLRWKPSKVRIMCPGNGMASIQHRGE